MVMRPASVRTLSTRRVSTWPCAAWCRRATPACRRAQGRWRIASSNADASAAVRQPGNRGGDRARHLGAVDAAEIDQPRAVSMRSRCMCGDRGQPDQREVAVTARKLGEADRRSRLHRRKLHRDDQFARPKIGLEQALEEILGLHLALARDAAQHQRRSERHGASRQLGRRIGIGQAAAERAAVADRDVADVRRGVGQQRQMLSGPVRSAAVRRAASARRGAQCRRRAIGRSAPGCRRCRPAASAPTAACSGRPAGSGRRRSARRRRRRPPGCDRRGQRRRSDIAEISGLHENARPSRPAGRVRRPLGYVSTSRQATALNHALVQGAGVLGSRYRRPPNRCYTKVVLE